MCPDTCLLAYIPSLVVASSPWQDYLSLVTDNNANASFLCTPAGYLSFKLPPLSIKKGPYIILKVHTVRYLKVRVCWQFSFQSLSNRHVPRCVETD